MDEWIGFNGVPPPLPTTPEILIHTFHDDIGLFLFLGIIICIIMYASFNAGVYIANKGVYIANKVVKTINGS